MKTVILTIVTLAVCASALEFKPLTLKPVDGQILKNGQWVEKE